MINSEFINKLDGVTDKFKSVITALFFDVGYKDVYDFVNQELKKVNTIKDNYKKKFMNDRCYLFREYIKKNSKPEDTINSLFLVAVDNVEEIKLDNNTIEYLKKYNVFKKTFFWGKGYNIHFLEDVFINKNMRHVIEINEKEFKHFELSEFKKNEISTNKLDKFSEYLKDKNSQKILFHGSNPILKSLSYSNMIYYKRMFIEDIISAFELNDTLENHNRLKEFLDNLNNPKINYKIKSGKDLIKAINNSMLKTLFYCVEKKEKLYETFNKELFNFELIEIKNLEKDDISRTLYNDYGGFIGESYY